MPKLQGQWFLENIVFSMVGWLLDLGVLRCVHFCSFKVMCTTIWEGWKLSSSTPMRLVIYFYYQHNPMWFFYRAPKWLAQILGLLIVVSVITWKTIGLHLMNYLNVSYWFANDPTFELHTKVKKWAIIPLHKLLFDVVHKIIFSLHQNAPRLILTSH